MNEKDLLREEMRSIRDLNLSSRIGDICECPVCGNEFIKGHIKQCYCGGRNNQTCKNAYNNFIHYGTIYNFGRFLRLYNGIRINKSNKNDKVNKYIHFSF